MTAIATAQAYEPRYIRLDPRDNVAIVVNDLGLPAKSRFACGLELRSFVRCATERQAPLVSGESAKQALDLAFEITRQIAQSEAGAQLSPH